MTPFTHHRQAALALLGSVATLTIKEGQFLGGVAFTDHDLSERQHRWLRILLERHALPPLVDQPDEPLGAPAGRA